MELEDVNLNNIAKRLRQYIERFNINRLNKLHDLIQKTIK